MEAYLISLSKQMGALGYESFVSIDFHAFEPFFMGVVP